MFRQFRIPRKCRNERCISSHNTVLHGADSVYPAKPLSNNNIKNLKSIADTSKPSAGQQPPSERPILSPLDVKGFLQLTELQLVNSSDTKTTELVLLRRCTPLVITLGLR